MLELFYRTANVVIIPDTCSQAERRCAEVDDMYAPEGDKYPSKHGRAMIKTSA